MSAPGMRPGYGDVLAEYRAIRESVALVQGAHEVIWVEGPEAASFLQGILSQDVEAMPIGTVARSFLLAPQGKLEALLWLARGVDEVAVICDWGRAEHVAERLGYYRIRVKAEIRPEFGDVWELWGPDSHRLTNLTSSDRWERRDDETVLIPIPMGQVRRVLVIGEQPVSGLAMAGRLATTAARVDELEPVFGVDVDEKTIPQETGLVDAAASFTKGCYLGQELVARIDTRGHVNRMLRRVAVTRNVVPPEGSVVSFDGKDVGRLTSVSENLTSPVGLALLRREVETGDEVLVSWGDDDGERAPAVVQGDRSSAAE